MVAPKLALIMETKNMAKKLTKYGIRVSSISPGTTKTDLNKEHWHNNTQVWQDQVNGKIPLMRAACPDEIAEFALFLAREKASFMTGEDILVDGGQCTALIR